MFQQLINGSIAVLTRPSVATFERHERDDLRWASIYVAIGALVTAVLAAIGFIIQRPAIEAQIADAQRQLDELAGQGVDTAFVGQLLSAADPASRSLVGDAVGSIIWTLLGFALWVAVFYFVGRAFGGSGQMGELAWDVSLFWVPMMVLRQLLGVISIGPLAILTFLAGIAIFFFNLFLTYLGVQSGLNLQPDKALFTILVAFLVLIVAACILFPIVGIFVGLLGALF